MLNVHNTSSGNENKIVICGGGLVRSFLYILKIF